MDIEGGERDIFENIDVSTLVRVRRLALEYHDNIRPGTLRRIQDILAPTHRVCSVSEGSYGILQAELRQDVAGPPGGGRLAELSTADLATYGDDPSGADRTRALSGSSADV